MTRNDENVDTSHLCIICRHGVLILAEGHTTSFSIMPSLMDQEEDNLEQYSGFLLGV